ncbi:leucine-rich repeat domain-containing protein [Aspergillus undulatus]|uniref:leucine-rich repeat domain-containing protein n=1 Tax=Aspergillus undulatus TaxID=1810928 RepID=UPI003CCE3FCD
MDNEPQLPPPPRIRHRSPNKPQAQNHPRASKTKDRTHRHLSRFDDLSSQPSSDPALFSSDDIPASGLENYHAPAAGSGSRKRRYRGTWWGEMVKEKEKETKRKRADFKDKRLVDSGVWMGSDESVSVSGASGFGLHSEDAAWLGEELIRDEGVGLGANVNAYTQTAATGMQGLMPGLGLGPGRAGLAKKATAAVEEPREHQVARAIVNECLERGLDSIDLSGGNIRAIPAGLLRPLQHLTKLPSINEPPISEEVYSSLQPFLRLFLAGNALTIIPGELFELDSLRVLSLRNNKLTEIPPAIRRLTKLQELNLSVNRLTVLPWELLWLIRKGDLKQLTVRPNPLLQIEDPAVEIAQWHDDANTAPTPRTEDDYELEDGDEEECGNGSEEFPTPTAVEYDGPPPEEAWAPIHVATGPVQRFNAEGFLIPDAALTETPSSTVASQPPSQPQPQPQHHVHSRMPSLREASLLSLSKSPYFDTLPDLSSTECELYFPPLMLRLLRIARDIRNSGGRSCSICHRSFVIARTEWIEWWDVRTYENGLKGPRVSGEKLRPLPFRRVGCSLGCLPTPTWENYT